jgi:glutamate synthase (NADPH/NADH) small chain
MGDIKGFLKFSRQEPIRRPVSDRITDFKEFSRPLGEEKLTQQAARCMDCGVPFCHSHTGCPVENNIPYWNKLVENGKWQEAIASLHSTNNFPEFTGRLCPAPCESACVLGIHQSPVTIRMIEWDIIEHAFRENWVRPMPPSHRTHQKIAIVGSGPAGLAAAQELARLGHDVTVFEKNAQFGGLLRYGIPDFKMEKWVIDRRLDQLQKEGVQFKGSVHIGDDNANNLSIASLKTQYDAVCLTIGAEEPRDLSIPGRSLQGICQAMDYLKIQNEACHFKEYQSQFPDLNASNKNVIVIGGGDTGSDCIGTARRQGCRSVTQLEILPQPPPQRSSATPWPMWPIQLRSSHAHEEGCQREWSLSTLEFIGSNGKLEKLRAARVESDPKSQQFLEFPADLVILAMGFSGPKWYESGSGLSQDFRRNILTDKNYMTSIPGVFSAGDARRGASLIVWAIREGRDMAKSVNLYLNSKTQT